MKNLLLNLSYSLENIGYKKESKRVQDIIKKIAVPIEEVSMGGRNIYNRSTGEKSNPPEVSTSEAEKLIHKNLDDMIRIFENIEVPINIEVVPETHQFSDKDYFFDIPSMMGVIDQDNLKELEYEIKGVIRDGINIHRRRRETFIPLDNYQDQNREDKIENFLNWLASKADPKRLVIVWGLGGISQANSYSPVGLEVGWNLHDLFHALEESESEEIKSKVSEIKKKIIFLEEKLEGVPGYKDLEQKITPNVTDVDTTATAFSIFLGHPNEMGEVIKELEGKEREEAEEVLNKILPLIIRKANTLLSSLVGKFIFLP